MDSIKHLIGVCSNHEDIGDFDILILAVPEAKHSERYITNLSKDDIIYHRVLCGCRTGYGIFIFGKLLQRHIRLLETSMWLSLWSHKLSGWATTRQPVYLHHQVQEPRYQDEEEDESLLELQPSHSMHKGKFLSVNIETSTK